ncbi:MULTISPECIES: hypothetical protein [unclassified Streptomyces]|uniref:hypothetical protein n=1 Tax=unclassified Streptomyces TaxID=2593676 RepID=UPI001F0CEB79|nr:hypothetical protein [Streptomyces sp. A1136]
MIVEPIGTPAGLDRTMAPARERIGELLATYSPDQLKVLFDYVARAADAYQVSVEHLRTASAP